MIRHSIFYRVVFVLVFVLVQFMFTACASMDFLWQGEADTTALNDPGRGPASIEEMDSVGDNTRTVETEVIESVKQETQNFGSTEATNEYSGLARRNSDSARRGYRRGAQVWDGIDSVNEGSLWNPDNQSNFYFS